MSPPEGFSSLLGKAPSLPPDAIFAPTTILQALILRKFYLDGEDKPWVLPSVKFAKEVVKDSGHEYLPIASLKTI